MKKYGLTLLLFIGTILLFSFILAIFNSLNLLYFAKTNTIIFIGMVLVLFVIGYEFGKRALQKGFLEGIKIGASLIILMIIINTLFYQTGFSIERVIYYTVLILSSTLGSMVGINKSSRKD